MEAIRDIKGRLRSYVEDNFIMGARAERLGDDDSFLEHHVLDSTGFLELVTFVEETYGVKVEEDEMIPENLDSLNSLAQFLARKGVV
jgi:acyl carrier protein